MPQVKLCTSQSVGLGVITPTIRVNHSTIRQCFCKQPIDTGLGPSRFIDDILKQNTSPMRRTGAFDNVSIPKFTTQRTRNMCPMPVIRLTRIISIIYRSVHKYDLSMVDTNFTNGCFILSEATMIQFNSRISNTDNDTSTIQSQIPCWVIFHRIMFHNTR